MTRGIAMRRIKNRRPTLNCVARYDGTMSYMEFVLRRLVKDGFITMSIGQWDDLLHGSYDAGLTLLELDEDENVVAAYRRPK